MTKDASQRKHVATNRPRLKGTQAPARRSASVSGKTQPIRAKGSRAGEGVGLLPIPPLPTSQPDLTAYFNAHSEARQDANAARTAARIETAMHVGAWWLLTQRRVAGPQFSLRYSVWVADTVDPQFRRVLFEEGPERAMDVLEGALRRPAISSVRVRNHAADYKHLAERERVRTVVAQVLASRRKRTLSDSILVPQLLAAVRASG